MRAGNFFSLPAHIILLLLRQTYARELPYNPTRVFLSPQNPRVAYVLQPTGTQISLSSLDVSKTVDPSNLSLKTIFQTLPFLSDKTNTPLNAIIDSGGNITTYSGSCGGVGQIWKLGVQDDGTGIGSWSQWRQQSQAQDSPIGAGPRFLSSGIAFSSNVSARERDQKYYYFGGMCPNSGSTVSTWQGTANYTNNILSLSASVADGTLTYAPHLATTRNLPIAQAGQSLTALPPTYSNRTDGSRTQQQDFVLLGGHTQTAFMNMSQVALWSLPQEAWTYFPVTQGQTTTRTDLAVRDSSQIQPRSGHTAVLTSDGTKIIVFGGWVGNVNTPASPQLVVLNVAQSYGGTGDWTWTVPDITSNHGPAAGSGLYGHGAVMLPGDVMLLIGGNAIAAPSSKFRRAIGSSSAYLYNVSSSSWLSTYSIPADANEDQQPVSTSGPLSTVGQKAGLGIGAVAVVVLFGVVMWYYRRNKRRQEERSKRHLTFPAHSYGFDSRGMTPAMSTYSTDNLVAGHHGIAQATEQTDFAGPSTQQGWKSTAHETERTGLLVEVPSPTRGLRKSASGSRRGPYPFERRQSRNMEVIEETHGQEDRMTPADTSDAPQSPLQIHTNGPSFDPLVERNMNDALGSHPVSAEASPHAAPTAKAMERQVSAWLQDWEKAARELLYSPEPEGRTSPSKSDRTQSTLSDNSAHSSWSNQSETGVSRIRRSLSTHSAALLNSFSKTLGGSTSADNSSPTSPPLNARMSLPSQRRRQRSSTTGSGGGNSPTGRLRVSPPQARPDSDVLPRDSFTVARTSFTQLQAEGEALLGDSSPYAAANRHSRHKSEVSSASRDKKTVSWYGSVKRALSGAYATGSPSNTRSTSLGVLDSQHDDRSSSSSPIKDQGSEDLPPRRAISDAAFLRGKRGAKDWKIEDEDDEDAGPVSPAASEAGGEDDWDVEKAAENRVVQLMFTVPRQRLRVVNVDADARSVLSTTDEKKTSFE